MSTAHTKVFTNNRSQAVRLPKSVALPESVREVDIIALGNKRLIVPAGDSWDSWFDGARISDDFMQDRDQPADQLRENL
jgi:antitoxin VapB